MARKDVNPDTGERRRIIIILLIGLPILFAVYGYFFFLDKGSFEGTELEKGPQIVTSWCITAWDFAVDKVKSLAEGPDDADLEVADDEKASDGKEAFAPGSAGNLTDGPRMYGMEVPLEEHRKLVLESTRGGQLSVPDEVPEKEATEETEGE